MTLARAVIVSLMRRHLDGLLDPFVTLLEVHKLMYFMQAVGEPLNLNFAKAHHGPYAENLRHVLREVEGHLMVGYKDGGDSPGKELQLLPGAVEDADAFLVEHPKTKERLSSVVKLIEGFESPFGLELLATVHWITTERPHLTDDEVIAHTYAWNPQKRQFSKRQIKLALDRLKTRGLIP